MQRSGTLTVTLPSDREVMMTRVFSAPRHLVFDALTKPEFLKRWFSGPPGWTLEVCEFDARVGGAYRYVWHHANGEVMGMGGRVVEIVAPERVVASEKFDNPWYPGDAQSTIVLTEVGGKTTLTLTVRYESKQARDGVLKFPMTTGVEHGYDRLAAWLEEEMAR